MVIKISELFCTAAVELGHFIINYKVEFLAGVIKKNSYGISMSLYHLMGW